MKRLRQACQALFLLLFVFLFLQTESTGTDELGYPVKLYLDFDPLLLITTLLSAHSVSKMFFLSFSTILLTLFLGRVFCGWICPFGTLHNMVGAFKKNVPRPSINWHKFKYYILIFLLFSSLFTAQLAGIVDPLSFLIRSFSISIYPAFNFAVRSFFDWIYEIDPPGIVFVSEKIYGALKATVLSFTQPIFQQSFFIGTIFSGYYIS